ncbi:MAG: ABC transporter permease [Alphaproteobacteria bacterium]|nr:ABC transporter permease [Alphaproteobacteria bacterium]
MADATPPAPHATFGAGLWQAACTHPTVAIGAALLALIALSGIAAPLLTVHDPQAIDPLNSMAPSTAENLLGTDHLGRDVLSRILYGTRVSLAVGTLVAAIATVVGLAIGILAGFVRLLDAVVMRVMDGLMSIPAVLFAIALMAVFRASVETVVIALAIVEVPRVVRLVRSVVLTLRELPFVEGAIVSGSTLPAILWRHILPNTLAPLTVQATYIAASAIIVEAALSFLGAGTPPEIPSWGNMMAESRAFFLLDPALTLMPGVALTITVLAVNMLGDGLRDGLDPRLQGRL